MLFSEPVFFAFFAVYLPLHLVFPRQLRIYLVIVGSTIFYGYWRVDYTWLPYLLTLVAWSGANWINRTQNDQERRARLTITLIALFVPLATFKYAYFFVHDVAGVLPWIYAAPGDVTWLRVALPLAVSFVTFTLAAYIIDVYRRRYQVELRLTTLLGYVLFFPHLIAGPILRPRELLPQLHKPRPALDARFILGLTLFALGLVKKLVFADGIAGVVDEVFKGGAAPTRLEYLLGIYGYSMQIYCDFSGYTDMAIGIAYVLGVRLPTNFLRPYGSTSVIEFWRRWHITLSHWLRDYLYIPLGGNRLGRTRQLLNMMITMVLGGLWHGANWTFIVWGALHGIGLTAAHGLSGPIARAGLRLPRWLSVFVTFNFVTLAWVYFRSPDLATAHRVLAGPFIAASGDLAAFAARYTFELVLLGAFLASHAFDQHARVRFMVQSWNRGVILALVASAFLVAITVSHGSSAKFIYFDF